MRSDRDSQPATGVAHAVDPRRSQTRATSSTGVAAVRARGLGHRYGSRDVLRAVDLDVEAGELVVIAGPNGVGKSTLLRALLGLLPVTAGEVLLLGDRLETLSRRAIAQRSAFVPQGFHTDFALSVGELVAMGRTPHVGRFRSEGEADRKAIAAALAATETRDLADVPFNELSGGEQQRVLLARAFAQDTPVLILDEPNANLDLRHTFQLLSLVRARADAGTAVVAVLHDLNLAARFADRIVLLSDGVVSANGPPIDVLTVDRIWRVFGVHAKILDQGEGLLVAVQGVDAPDDRQ